MIIGITGGTGCGKSTFLQVIAQQGGIIIDCDKLYHELLKTDKKLLSNIDARFPGMVEQGVLQRKKLGQLVFTDPKALKDLNTITHTAVKQAVICRLTPEPRLAAIDAIGLFESGLNELCKLTVAVTAPKQARIQRLITRENIDKAYALARIDAQPSCEDFSKLCDYTLQNDTSEADFQEKCLAFLRRLDII